MSTTLAAVPAADKKNTFPYLPAAVKAFQEPAFLQELVADPIAALKSLNISVDEGVGIKITMDGTSAGGSINIYVTNAKVNWNGHVNLNLSA